MNKLILVALAVAASATPIIPQPEGQIDASGLAYAVDFAQALNTTQYSCLFNTGNRVVFVRGYMPTGLGSFDGAAITNIRNAYSIGVGTEVYMTPATTSSKTGATQFNEMYTAFTNNGINIRFVWIQVTSPVNWGSSYTNNLKLIDSIRTTAMNRGVAVGFYTNQYDWSQITNNYTGYSKAGAKLWYWHTTGGGSAGATAPNYSDFYNFGGWTIPVAKQFSQNVNICGLWVNRDIYTSSSSFAKLEKMEGPVVGTLFQ